ncbi:hypothetical protein K8R03_05055 [Candidatus Kaiserbacteria bacterium]|nr:hypothetical protein [Candidatus Kaiserbacteria bacterium]
MEKSSVTIWQKAGIAWVGVFLFRFLLLSFRAPNVEPMLATIMPFSKRIGAFGSFAFAFSGIVLYDIATLRVGAWTWVTACAYGLLAIASYAYFSRRTASRARFVGFGIVATLAYDAVTGLTVGPIFFNQSFSSALAGQLPFTVLHLLGTITFAVFLSPVVAAWVAREPQVVRLAAVHSAQ